jgi:GNAT superfamily N-acetyltransferase
MITIDLLKNRREAIDIISNIWHEGLGKVWMPEIDIDEIQSLYYDELHRDMPLTYIALDGATPVGSCTLQLEDGVNPDLGPWISDLVVVPKYQKQGIGKLLMDVVIGKAREIGFEKLYLFTFDTKTREYYQRRGWTAIDTGEFKSRLITVMEINLVLPAH